MVSVNTSNLELITVNTLKMLIRKTPVIREIFAFLLRAKVSFGYLAGPIKAWIVWLFRSREFTNFTYDLSELNKLYLISVVAHIMSRSFDEIAAYMAEVENDLALRNHIENSIRASKEKFFADTPVHYGRRLGWYAFVRASRPKIIVETGVDKGLGSCVLTSALLRNTQEGYPGHYYGTDINPSAGYLLNGVYANYGEILYGDSVKSLEGLDQEIDIFINDSDHSADYERREYETIINKLSPNAILLGDNSHYTDELQKFALATDRSFIFFQENPLKHWYPGAGIGIAFPR